MLLFFAFGIKPLQQTLAIAGPPRLPPRSAGLSPRGVPRGVFAAGVCAARHLPACVYTRAGCEPRAVLGGGCGRARGALHACYGSLGGGMRTLSARPGARVCAACPAGVAMPQALACCTRAACPQHAAPAWGRGASRGRGGCGTPTLVPGVRCGWGCGCFWGLAPPPPPAAPHRAGASGAEERGAGLGSVGPGVAGRGSRVRASHPQFLPPGVQECLRSGSATSLPSRGACCPRVTPCQGCPTSGGAAGWR